VKKKKKLDIYLLAKLTKNTDTVKKKKCEKTEVLSYVDCGAWFVFDPICDSTRLCNIMILIRFF